MNKDCNKCDYQEQCKDHFLYCPLDGHNTPSKEKEED